MWPSESISGSGVITQHEGSIACHSQKGLSVISRPVSLALLAYFPGSLSVLVGDVSGLGAVLRASSHY